MFSSLLLIAYICVILIFESTTTVQGGDLPKITPCAHEGLDAVLWMQTSAEFKAAAHSAYTQAGRAVDIALAAPEWTAAPEQSGQYEFLPPAVIVDIDETILDNSLFEGELVRSHGRYSDSLWNTWVSQARAEAIPGSLKFIRYCEQKNVKVFYITNRSAKDEEATKKNLSALGYPVTPEPDVMLCLGERPEWNSSDKGTRRAYVAKTHRILVMVGDDLGDFLSGIKDTPQIRDALLEKHIDKFGERWFIIPNPAYGSWERSLYDFRNNLSHEEILKMKNAFIESFRSKH